MLTSLFGESVGVKLGSAVVGEAEGDAVGLILGPGVVGDGDGASVGLVVGCVV